MKKIIILAVFSVLLVSCGANTVDKKENTLNNVTDINVNTVIDTEGDSNNIETLYRSIDRLKTIDITEEDIFTLNGMINDIYNRNIINKAFEKKDIKICSELGEGIKRSCEEKIIISLKDPNSCEKLSNTGSINNCKNKIILIDANKNNDETICEQLIDESEEKNRINDCKNKIYFTKAIKNLDNELCNKISEEMEKEMCIEEIKIKSEMMKEIESRNEMGIE